MAARLKIGPGGIYTVKIGDIVHIAGDDFWKLRVVELLPTGNVLVQDVDGWPGPKTVYSRRVPPAKLRPGPPQEKTAPVSPDVELAQLREENRDLRQQIKVLQSLLAQRQDATLAMS